jgi:hypothetical protein
VREGKLRGDEEKNKGREAEEDGERKKKRERGGRKLLLGIYLNI